MALTGTTAKIGIEVEGTTEAAAASFDRLRAAEKAAKEEVVALDDRLGKFDAATAKAAKTTAEAAKGMGKARSAALAFEGAISQVEKGQMSLKQGVMSVASAFGPLGIAIGIAGGLLVGYAEEQYHAAEAAKEHTKEIAKQKREVEANARALKAAHAVERIEREVNADDARRAEREIYERADELKALENTLAQHGRGKDNSALIAREAELRADNLRSVHDSQGAIAVEREEELRVLAEIGEKEREHTKEKKKQFEWQSELVNQMRMAENLSGIQRDGSDSRAFATGLADAQTARVAGSMQRSDPAQVLEMDKFRAGRDRDDQLRGIESGRASDMGGPGAQDREITRIQAERDAKVEYYDELERLTTDELSRAEITEDRKQAYHDAEIARLAEETSAREETFGRQMGIAGAVADSMSSVAAAYLTTGDLSAKGFKKAVAEFGKAESIRLAVVAVREGVLAIAAAASFNAPQALLHGAAAAKAVAGAVIIGGMTAALGGFGGMGATKNVSGLGGDAFGPGMTPAANEGPRTSNSQKDTTPLSPSEQQLQQSNSANTGSYTNGGTVINIGSVQTTGAIDDTTMVKILQGARRVGANLGKASV